MPSEDNLNKTPFSKGSGYETENENNIVNKALTEDAKSSAFKVLASPKSPKQNPRKNNLRIRA